MNESAVDKMNDAIDAIIDLYRAQMGCSPRRHEIYDVYQMSMQGRMFADDQEAETITASGSAA